MKQASFKFVRKVSLLYKKPGDRSGSGNKIFLSETTEDLEKIMKRNAKMKRRRFQEDSDSDEEIPAPSWLEDRNDGDIKINNEAFENPILKAHAEIIKKTGDVSAFRDFSHVRNYERYLPQSQFFTHTDILTKSPSVQPEVRNGC